MECSFIVEATVITIISYDCKIFIVQATGCKSCFTLAKGISKMTLTMTLPTLVPWVQDSYKLKQSWLFLCHPRSQGKFCHSLSTPKVDRDENQNNRDHAVTACISLWCHGQCKHNPVRCMYQPVTSQADACSYCMGSVVLILSQIYLFLQLLWSMPFLQRLFANANKAHCCVHWLSNSLFKLNSWTSIISIWAYLEVVFTQAKKLKSLLPLLMVTIWKDRKFYIEIESARNLMPVSKFVFIVIIVEKTNKILFIGIVFWFLYQTIGVYRNYRNVLPSQAVRANFWLISFLWGILSRKYTDVLGKKIAHSRVTIP